MHQHLPSPGLVMSKAPFCLPAQQHEHVSQPTVALKIWWCSWRVAGKVGKNFFLGALICSFANSQSSIPSPLYTSCISILQSTANKVVLLVLQGFFVALLCLYYRRLCFELNDCCQAWVFLIVIFLLKMDMRRVQVWK